MENLLVRDDDKANRSGPTKRHIGLLGVITLLSQWGMTMKSEDTTKLALRQIASQEMAKVQLQVNTLREERERDFVRKDEFRQAIFTLGSKIDRLDDRVVSVQDKVSKMEGYLKAQGKGYFGQSGQEGDGRQVSSR